MAIAPGGDMSKIFVTGGAGFIGRAIVDNLEKLGHEMFIYDKAVMKAHELREYGMLANIMEKAKPGIVIHLGAVPGVSQPMHDALGNLEGTMNVLGAMRASGTKRIVFASTGGVYGETQYKPTMEASSTSGAQASFYASSKLAAEGFISAWCAENKGVGTVLRLGTIIGPGNAKGFIKDFVRKLNQKQTELEVLGDGWQTKSYIHINDMVSAVVHVLNAEQTAPFEIYNVSHDTAPCIRDLIPFVVDEVLTKQGKLEPELKFGNAQAGFFGDIPHIWLDNKKLKSIGWKPMKTIEDAVRENVQWLMRNPEVFG